MINDKKCQTPMSSSKKLVKDKWASCENPSLYKSLVDSLQYVTLIRPEIAFTINELRQCLLSGVGVWSVDSSHSSVYLP